MAGRAQLAHQRLSCQWQDQLGPAHRPDSQMEPPLLQSPGSAAAQGDQPSVSWAPHTGPWAVGSQVVCSGWASQWQVSLASTLSSQFFFKFELVRVSSYCLQCRVTTNTLFPLPVFPSLPSLSSRRPNPLFSTFPILSCPTQRAPTPGYLLWPHNIVSLAVSCVLAISWSKIHAGIISEKWQ